MISENDKINVLRETLAGLVGDWEDDACSPHNHVRKTGLGDEVARVDRWCGGFQSPHWPITIGWRVNVRQQSGSSHGEDGVVLVKYPRAVVDKHSGLVVPERFKSDLRSECEQAVDEAIEKAKELADQALGGLL